MIAPSPVQHVVYEQCRRDVEQEQYRNDDRLDRGDRGVDLRAEHKEAQTNYQYQCVEHEYQRVDQRRTQTEIRLGAFERVDKPIDQTEHREEKSYPEKQEEIAHRCRRRSHAECRKIRDQDLDRIESIRKQRAIAQQSARIVVVVDVELACVLLDVRADRVALRSVACAQLVE